MVAITKKKAVKEKVAKRKKKGSETREVISQELVILPNKATNIYSRVPKTYQVARITRLKVRLQYSSDAVTTKHVKHYTDKAAAENAVIRLMAKDAEREDTAKRKVHGCEYSVVSGVAYGGYPNYNQVKGYWVKRKRKYTRNVDSTREDITVDVLRRSLTLEQADKVLSQELEA